MRNKKGDIICTYLNSDAEELMTIRVNYKDDGVLKIDLKQFSGFKTKEPDLFINEIVNGLFDYVFNFCDGDEPETINVQKIV
jgi:HSP20 family molecular chaperone IbpA